MVVTSQHQLTPTATGAPARAGVRGCLPPMDAEPSSSRGRRQAGAGPRRVPCRAPAARGQLRLRGQCDVARRCGAVLPVARSLVGPACLSLLRPRPPDLDRTATATEASGDGRQPRGPAPAARAAEPTATAPGHGRHTGRGSTAATCCLSGITVLRRHPCRAMAPSRGSCQSSENQSARFPDSEKRRVSECFSKKKV